ncbi:MAG: hypothetical protein KJ587_18030 [Alphaproteobacteria bacterium]|nr:hypothetical protein [Alphaproteobacteria bacterium]
MRCTYRLAAVWVRLVAGAEQLRPESFLRFGPDRFASTLRAAVADFPLDALCDFLDLLHCQHRCEASLDHPSGAFSRRHFPPIGVAAPATADESNRPASSRQPTMDAVVVGPDEEVSGALAVRLWSTPFSCIAFQSSDQVFPKKRWQLLGKVGFKHAHDLTGPEPVGAAFKLPLEDGWRRHVDHNDALVVAGRNYGTIRHSGVLDDQD